MGIIKDGSSVIVWGQAVNVKNRYTKKGKEYTTFAVSYDKEEGENVKSLYINCTAWGNLASKFANRLERGDSIVVLGKMGYWTGTEGGQHENVTADYIASQMAFSDDYEEEKPEGYDTAQEVSDEDILNSIF